MWQDFVDVLHDRAETFLPVIIIVNCMSVCDFVLFYVGFMCCFGIITSE